MNSNTSEGQMEALAHKRSRRRFMMQASLAAAGAGLLGSTKLATPVAAQNLDAAVLNFALNLEYLEAEYYLRAVSGSGLSGADTVGTGAYGGPNTPPGGVVTKGGSTVVPWATEPIRQYAVEIAADELAHVRLLRAALAGLGGAVARPTIDLRDSFTAAAVAAGVITGGTTGTGAGMTCPPGQPSTPRPAPFFVPTQDCQGWVPNDHPLAFGAGSPGGPQTFDPFADEVSFLLGAFIFEDVGVTAYKGAAALLTDKGILEAAAGLLAVEAYHAGTVRTILNARAQTAPDLVEKVEKISNLRDAVDGPSDRDQGIVLNGMANIVPTDENGLAFSRNTSQVLRIAYLGGDAAGGFFPNGVNGPISMVMPADLV